MLNYFCQYLGGHLHKIFQRGGNVKKNALDLNVLGKVLYKIN